MRHSEEVRPLTRPAADLSPLSQGEVIYGAAMSKPRSVVFWVLVAAGGVSALCCFSTVALLGLGALAADDVVPGAVRVPTVSAEGSGGDWIPAGEVARSQSLTQPLAGGRWFYQYGANVDSVLSRSGNWAMVQTNSSAGLYEFSFVDDGTYQLKWLHRNVMNGQKTESTADERGDWSLDGTTLTLTPRSQEAVYRAYDERPPQTVTDKDLSPRTYQVVDITLETVAHTGAPMKRWPGIELSGPGAKWGFDDRISVALQRL